jgi:hypothetical protein
MKTFKEFLEEAHSLLDEGYKKPPRIRMLGKAAKRFLQAVAHGRNMGRAGKETTEGQIEAHKANKKADQFARIATALVIHNAEIAKDKEQENKDRGLSKRKVQNLIRIDQNRRTLPVKRMRAQAERLWNKGHSERSTNVDDMRMSRAQRHLRGYRNPEIGRFKPNDDG